MAIKLNTIKLRALARLGKKVNFIGENSSRRYTIKRIYVQCPPQPQAECTFPLLLRHSMVVDTGQFLLVGLHPTTNLFHISHVISQILSDLRWFWIGGMVDRSYFLYFVKNDLLRLYICECLSEADYIHLHLVRYDRLCIRQFRSPTLKKGGSRTNILPHVR